MLNRRKYVSESERTHEIPDDLGTDAPKTVLILEDDVSLSLVLKEYLESFSLGVTVVSSGVEGVQKVLAKDFDAIVCDMVMPNFPGDMFYRAVERARPHLAKRFIFMTGHQGDPKIDAFIRSVRGLILWKPFQFPDLLEAIQSVIRKSPRRAA